VKIVSIQSVFFFVADLERSKVFYRGVLGAEPVEQGPNIASFNVGGVELMLHADGDTPRVTPGSARGAGVTVHFQVEDIHALWERLHGLGIHLTEQPTPKPWGFTEFGVRDPDGYEVEFLEPSSP